MNFSKLSPEQKSAFARLIKTSGEQFNCFPLAPEQRRLWFFDQLVPDSPLFNLPAALWVNGDINLDALAAAYSAITERHAILRCEFVNVEGEPYLALMPKFKGKLDYVDVRRNRVSVPDDFALQLADSEGKVPFDLESGELVRIKAIQTAETCYLLVINMHHIVSDAWSISILIRELFELYRAYCTNSPAQLPPLSIQYTDYAAWRNKSTGTDAFEHQVNYWRKRLCGNNAPTTLPSARRGSKPSYSGNTIAFTVSERVPGMLRPLCRELGITVQTVLLTSFKLLLSRYSNSRNVTVGSPVSTRTRTELEPLIGFFINTLVLRTEFANEMTVRDALLSVSKTLLEAQENGDVPFDSLVEQLRPFQPEELRNQPYFHIMFAAQPPISSQTLQFHGLQIENVHLNSGTAKTDLAMFIGELEDGIGGTVEFNSELFDRAAISKFIEHFQNTLEAIVQEPNRRISELSWLSSSEEAGLLAMGNSGCAVPDIALPLARLRRMMSLHANRPAVICSNECLTYDALHQRAIRISAQLRQQGVHCGDRVALLLDRNTDMVAAIIGVLYVGATYVPLDPSYPDERLIGITNDCKPNIIITDDANADKARQLHMGGLLLTSDASSLPPSEPDGDLPLHKDLPAYVIYTSGSTGKPKGVTLTHRGLALLVDAQIREFMVGPDSRVLQFSSPGFDASVSEIFCTLLGGGTLVVPPRSELLDPALLQRVIQQYGITHATLSPSLLASLSPDILEGLQVLVCAGEALPLPIAKQWGERLRVFNAYGPTEVTVCATLGVVPSDVATVKIGKPLPHIEAYVLDDYMQLVSVGVEGTLFVGGTSVAHGYCGRPDLTAERFVPNPFASVSTECTGMRLYNTGDRVRWCADGQLEFLGRGDDQIKLHGYRIELGEIEYVLCEQHGVTDAAAVLDTDGHNKYLVAYVAGTADVASLRTALQRSLPSFMQPRYYVILDTFPTNSHGKLDKRLLPRPVSPDDSSLSEDERPSSTMEVSVAQVWQQVFNRPNIGKAQDFFSCGGNSLLAIKLCVKLSQVLNQHVPVSLLFESPTIESLAGRLSKGGEHLAILSLSVQGRERNLILVPAMGGNLLTYHALANQIKDHYDCFELNASEVHQEIQEDIRLTARHYAESLIKFGKPFTLCGWSFGGILAIELANQLQKLGVEVQGLILLDPSVFSVGEHAYPSADTDNTKLVADSLVTAFATNEPEAITGFTGRWARERTALSRHRPDVDSTEDVVVFLSEEFRNQTAPLLKNPWPSFFKHTPVLQQVPDATHYSMLKAPAVEIIGRYICGRSNVSSRHTEYQTPLLTTL